MKYLHPIPWAAMGYTFIRTFGVCLALGLFAFWNSKDWLALFGFSFAFAVLFSLMVATRTALDREMKDKYPHG